MTRKPLLLIVSMLIPSSCISASPSWEELSIKGYNSLWAEPTTGRVFASNGKEIQISDDAGKTWTATVSPQAKGRHWNALGFDGPNDGKHLSLFPIDSPVGWITTDGGATWSTFSKPEPPAVKKHDGWTYGSADWSQPKPARLFGKEHHTTNLWLSSDTGKTWQLIANLAGYFGIAIAPDGALLVAATDGKGATLPPGSKPGVLRSTDDGKTWTQVYEGLMPEKQKFVQFADKLYCAALAGLLVSADAGKTWNLIPGSPENVTFGPYFGKTADLMLVVSLDGVHATRDGGRTWSLAIKKEELPESVRKANLPGYAYDPIHGVFLATGMGIPVFKADL